MVDLENDWNTDEKPHSNELNSKIIVLTRGIPASGKSTWAKEQGADLLVNKDQIREIKGITPENWVKEGEKSVEKYERSKVEDAMKDCLQYIIVDNTHIGHNNRHILFYEELAKKYNYKFIIKDFYISRDEAIERDNNREKKVGVDIIDKFIKIAGNGGYPKNPVFIDKKTSLEDVIICDIDGTIAFMSHKRSPYDYTKVIGDDVNQSLLHMLKLLNHKVVFLSGRSSECKKETLEWLDKKAGYSNPILYMREEGDKRCDVIVKKELYHKYIDCKYNTLAVFDDRNRVVDMWRLELGLPTYQVWYGNF